MNAVPAKPNIRFFPVLVTGCKINKNYGQDRLNLSGGHTAWSLFCLLPEDFSLRRKPRLL
jgi:hypothetical protein